MNNQKGCFNLPKGFGFVMLRVGASLGEAGISASRRIPRMYSLPCNFKEFSSRIFALEAVRRQQMTAPTNQTGTGAPQPKFLEAKAAFRIGSLMVPRGGLEPPRAV